MADTMTKFHEVETVLKEFLGKSPEFEGDKALARELGEKMNALHESILNLEGRDITQIL